MTSIPGVDNCPEGVGNGVEWISELFHVGEDTMNKLKYITITVALVGILAACSPTASSSPSASVSSPVPATKSTPTLTPTPQWTDEEQAAIDSVQKYIQVWTTIGQGLPDSNVAQIRDVAGDPIANDTQDLMTQWAAKGWHLEGAPSFVPSLVTPGALDYQGQRYHVSGCYIITGSYLADSSGNEVGTRGTERSPGTYEVIQATSGTYYVTDDSTEEGTC
ncbi:MAG: hypothetical protein FWF43_08490 [Propionibacteriaceae bacterium]|nr:hypothetical protein [Propionibacteriaceae bacterium]